MEQPNLLYIKTLSKGDRSFEEKIINIIKVEFPVEKKKYLKALRGNMSMQFFWSKHFQKTNTLNLALLLLITKNM
mgnify:CR=1 FL=1